MNVCDTVSFIP